MMLKLTYSLWRDEDDYRVDWYKSAEDIDRFIDAVGYPYSGAFSLIHEQKVRIIDADPIEDVQVENRIPGKVIFIENGKPVIVCGKGLLRVNELVDDKTKQSILASLKFRTRFHMTYFSYRQFKTVH